jgi:hypothetical protein
MKRLILTASLIVVASPALAQNVPTRTLSKPDAEYSEPFTMIAGVRELKDGRVIAIDPRDKTVQSWSTSRQAPRQTRSAKVLAW